MKTLTKILSLLTAGMLYITPQAYSAAAEPALIFPEGININAPDTTGVKTKLSQNIPKADSIQIVMNQYGKFVSKEFGGKIEGTTLDSLEYSVEYDKDNQTWKVSLAKDSLEKTYLYNPSEGIILVNQANRNQPAGNDNWEIASDYDLAHLQVWTVIQSAVDYNTRFSTLSEIPKYNPHMDLEKMADQLTDALRMETLSVTEIPTYIAQNITARDTQKLQEEIENMMDRYMETETIPSKINPKPGTQVASTETREQKKTRTEIDSTSQNGIIDLKIYSNTEILLTLTAEDKGNNAGLKKIDLYVNDQVFTTTTDFTTHTIKQANGEYWAKGFTYTGIGDADTVKFQLQVEDKGGNIINGAPLTVIFPAEGSGNEVQYIKDNSGKYPELIKSARKNPAPKDTPPESKIGAPWKTVYTGAQGKLNIVLEDEGINKGIVSGTLYENGKPVKTWTSTNLAWELDAYYPTKTTAGTYTYQLEVTDKGGNKTKSNIETITFTTDPSYKPKDTPPEAKIGVPYPTVLVGTQGKLNIVLEDEGINKGIVSGTLYENGKAIQTWTSTNLAWELDAYYPTKTTAGTYTYQLEVTDKGGNKTKSNIETIKYTGTLDPAPNGNINK
ncbi:MAG: Ig-like domain repeat protein [Candidatus Nanoarchaeia archaeon]